MLIMTLIINLIKIWRIELFKRMNNILINSCELNTVFMTISLIIVLSIQLLQKASSKFIHH